MTEHLREYHKLYPQVELYIWMGSPSDLLDDLNRGKLHVLFLRSQTEGVTGLHKKVLGEDPLELVMIRELDPAPDQASVPLEALKGVPMCLLRSDDLWGYSNYLIKECQRQGFTPNTTFRCYDTPMAMQLVQAGFGVSIFPVRLWKRSLIRGSIRNRFRGSRFCPIRLWCGAAICTMPAVSSGFWPCLKGRMPRNRG
mgnify:CR=1 FL=1